MSAKTMPVAMLGPYLVLRKKSLHYVPLSVT